MRYRFQVSGRGLQDSGTSNFDGELGSSAIGIRMKLPPKGGLTESCDLCWRNWMSKVTTTVASPTNSLTTPICQIFRYCRPNITMLQNECIV